MKNSIITKEGATQNSSGSVRANIIIAVADRLQIFIRDDLHVIL
jgi:hypothetical protein